MVLNAVQRSTPMDEIISTIATQLRVEPNIFQHLLSSTTIKGHLTSLIQRGLITMKLDGFQMVGHKIRRWTRYRYLRRLQFIYWKRKL